MEKRGLLIILVLLASVFFVMGACPHGVTICGINYNCGVSDGVCPETFGANCRDIVNVSCYYSDPDCGATCLTAGAGAIGNDDCRAKDITKPICCGNPGAGVCAACCPGVICNPVFAPAALPGAAYNSGGDYSCQANCSTGPSPTCNVAGNCINCSQQNGWYNTTVIPTVQWVDSTTNICQLQEQVYQEYRDYTAVGSICDYVKPTTSFRWANISGAIGNKSAGTICFVRFLECQLNDTCDGFGSCKPNYRPSTFVCRPEVGLCDVAENCTGSSATCPLTNLFAPTTTPCNAALTCSAGIGNNMYNSPGNYLCRGYCDGSNSCDWTNAFDCTNCGSPFCYDYDLANNPLFRSNITLGGGCILNTCIANYSFLDSCSASSTQDTTCSGSSRGPNLPYSCDSYDTSRCGCTVTAPNLNEVCDDWTCSGGNCTDSTIDWARNSWQCDATYQGTTRGCPTIGGTAVSYRCYKTNGPSWGWSSGALPIETACGDSYNNDWDANSYWDYDTDNRGGAGPSPHGDINCPVGVNSPEVPSNAYPGQAFNVNITPTVLANSISAKINETGTPCTFNSWAGSKAVFTCTAPAVSGTYTILFYIDTSKSYPILPNRTGTIVVAPRACSGFGDPGSCATGGCQWCIQCDSVFGRLANGNPIADKCVPLGTCSWACIASLCAADTCDGSNGCNRTCTGNLINSRICDGSCTCQIDWSANCGDQNCTTNRNCVGEGTTVLSLIGDRYVCNDPPTAGAVCEPSGTTTCATYTCNPASFGTSQSCNGRTYYCVSNGTDPVWNQTLPVTELYCNDGFDNDGDTQRDCADSECSPDTTPYCCDETTCTDVTSPDGGIEFDANLFDAAGNYGNPPNCCGNNPDEWYWNLGGGACCDQSSDCVDALGACFNNNTPLVEAHQQHCINHTWYPCNDTVHPLTEQRGTYNCTYDPSSGGYGWRTTPPLENCTDTVDNDNNLLTDCADPACAGNCTYNCPAPENMTAPGTCTDGIDNNCNGLIDAKDFSNCTEGSGSATASPDDRNCNNGGSDEVFPLSDLPDSPLFDSNDDGCCDLCPGMQFDTAFGARTQCGVPGRSCGSLNFSSWETGTVKYCCGDAANEFYRVNPLNASQTACCNNSNHCVDDTGNCQVGEEETEALCMDGIDNDCDRLIDCQDTNCTGTLTGFVTDETGRALSGAIIKSSPPGKLQECERTAPSLGDGSYTLDALIGSYNIIARKPGYDDNITFVTILPKPATQTLNFSLRNGSCHADCADSYYNCNPACAGLSFTNSTGGVDYCNIVSICANRDKGFPVTYTNDTTNITTEYTCCEGKITRAYPAKKAQVSGNMESLYVYQTIVKLKGKYVTLNIALGYPVQ